MNKMNRQGFSLIELLAVIAIIGILAALVTVAAPRALERAKISDVKSDFNNLRTALATYYTDHATYPPGYGFLYPTEDGVFRRGYMQRIDFFKTFDLYDRFNQGSHDSNGDDAISLLEYNPVSDYSPADALYIGTNNASEVN